MTDPIVDAEHRGSVGAATGRPRSAVADAAILEAAIETFCEQGYDGLSVEAVAARAGVAKSTIYRRYPTKIDLVMDALGCVAHAAIPTESTGDLRTDLLAIGHGYLAMLTDSYAGRSIPMMLAAKARSPELAAAHNAVVDARRSTIAAIIQAGIDRGELPAGTDAAIVADMLCGALFMRVFVTGRGVTDADIDSLVERLLAR